MANIAASDLGSHPCATVRLMDATAIDAPDRHYDLVVFALSFHHLPPALASKVFAEATRAADKLMIIDLPRLPSLRPLSVAGTGADLDGPRAAEFRLSCRGAVSYRLAASSCGPTILGRLLDP